MNVAMCHENVDFCEPWLYPVLLLGATAVYSLLSFVWPEEAILIAFGWFRGASPCARDSVPRITGPVFLPPLPPFSPLPLCHFFHVKLYLYVYFSFNFFHVSLPFCSVSFLRFLDICPSLCTLPAQSLTTHSACSEWLLTKNTCSSNPHAYCCVFARQLTLYVISSTSQRLGSRRRTDVVNLYTGLPRFI